MSSFPVNPWHAWAADKKWSKPPSTEEWDISALDDQSWSPLHYAAWMGGKEKVQWLLEQGSRLYSQHQSPLLLACRKSQTHPYWKEVAYLLWQADPCPEQARWGHPTYGGSLTLLEWAIENNVEWLLDECGKRQWPLEKRTFLIAYLNDSVRPVLKLDQYWGLDQYSEMVNFIPFHHPWWKDIFNHRAKRDRETLEQYSLVVEKETQGAQRL